MRDDNQCRECLRLAVQLRNAITTRNGSKETDTRVLIKRHKQEAHQQAADRNEVESGGGTSRAGRTSAATLRPDGQPYAADGGERMVVPLRWTPGPARLELSRGDAEQLCARLGFLLDGGRSLEGFARRYGM